MRRSPGGLLIFEGDEALRELRRQDEEARFINRFVDDVRHLRNMGIRPIGGAAPRGYTNTTEGAVALTAATAKTVCAVRSGATFNVMLKQFSLGFDGVTASAVPVLWELCNCTFGANAPGTNSTSTTINQKYGNRLANGMTAGKTWTTEPTTITVVDGDLLTPNGGLIVVQFPLNQEQEGFALNDGIAIRLNAPAAVNARASQMSEVC